MGKSRFLDAFEKIARKSRNRQTKTYGLAIYEAALRNITTRGENEYTLAAQDQCLELVCESQKAADSIILKMQTLAETLPEYAVLRSMACLLYTSLVDLCKHWQVPVSALGDKEHAVITAGGVDVREVDPKTMASKLCEGLYFAGEVLDVDARTGGYNLQIAWSTAQAAVRAL